MARVTTRKKKNWGYNWLEYKEEDILIFVVNSLIVIAA